MPSLHIMQIVASLKGGAAQHVVWLSEELKRLGHTVTIAAPADHSATVSRIQTAEINWNEISLDSRFPLKAFFQLRNLIRHGEFTHIHVHGHRAALITRLGYLSSMRLPPLIYTIHGYHPSHYFNWFSRMMVNALEQILSFQTHTFICVSTSTKVEVTKVIPWIEPRCGVIENGIQINKEIELNATVKRSEFRERHQVPENAFIIGTVARLQWQKSVDRLIHAFADYVQDYPLDRLLIVGDGPERKALERLAKELNVSGQCIFAGHQEEVFDFYAIMDLFVLPSRWEGLPLTVLEAWNAKVPVVVTDVPGSRDLVEDGKTGFLAQNSIQGLTTTMKRFRQKDEKLPTIVENAHTILREKYSIQHMAKRTEQLYQSVLASRGKKD